MLVIVRGFCRSLRAAAARHAAQAAAAAHHAAQAAAAAQTELQRPLS